MSPCFNATTITRRLCMGTCLIALFAVGWQHYMCFAGMNRVSHLVVVYRLYKVLTPVLLLLHLCVGRDSNPPSTTYRRGERPGVAATWRPHGLHWCWELLVDQAAVSHNSYQPVDAQFQVLNKLIKVGLM